MAGQNRDKIVEAFLALLAEQPFEKVDLRAIAQRAGLSLADLRREFNSVFDVLGAFVRSTDEKLLAEGFDPELSGTPARARLFEVLMQRIEILKDHRAAMRSIARSARSNPPFALALNGLALRSAQWMLAAAEIDSGGLQGCVRAQGLVVVMARTYRVWLDDEDPGLARTMAALDRELANGERALGLIGNLCRFVPRFGGGGRRRRRGMDNETAAA
jgi:AcrR family transcriptional regulator